MIPGGKEDKPGVSSSDDPVEERTATLLDEAHIIFDRLSANIDAINAKILAVFQIFLVLVTLLISVFGLVFDLSKFSCLDWVLFSWVFVITVITLGCLYYLIRPKKYEYPEIFGEKRFAELCNVNRQSLLSDFLYYTREAYNANFKTYALLSRGLQVSLILVALDLIIFALFICAYVIG
ncbi:hypothetical protein [uncultured Methanoculleus sp.]|mgnify:CR=1 FL=1|uniref:hypothetical protein n=1 Tax=uncultured Methanoculleus sp. TaxID=183762 RepID=UPI0032047DFA